MTNATGGNAYESPRDNWRRFDALPPVVRAILTQTVHEWHMGSIAKFLGMAFAATKSRRASVAHLRAMIARDEAEDCYRVYGPDHPQADAHGRKLRPAHYGVRGRK